MGQQGDAIAGCVGIFWGIPGSGGCWTLLIDRTPLASAELYGDFLTHPRGHYEVWSAWQKRPPKKEAAQAIAFHEYEDFPRGRIVHEIKTGRFIVYADRRLQRGPVIADIADKFALAAGTFVVRSDAHYRS